MDLSSITSKAGFSFCILYPQPPFPSSSCLPLVARLATNQAPFNWVWGCGAGSWSVSGLSVNEWKWPHVSCVSGGGCPGAAVLLWGCTASSSGCFVGKWMKYDPESLTLCGRQRRCSLLRCLFSSVSLSPLPLWYKGYLCHMSFSSI